MANILNNCFFFFFSFSGNSLRLFHLVSVICMLALMINKAKKNITHLKSNDSHLPAGLGSGLPYLLGRCKAGSELLVCFLV